MWKFSLLIAAFAVLLTGCARRPAPFIGADGRVSGWATNIGRDNPLVGRIWSPALRSFVDVPSFVSALGNGGFILVGEKHNNPDHHRIQAWIVRTVTVNGRRPAVAFEMFTTDQDGRLAAYLNSPGANAAGIGNAVGWDRTGWPDWLHYAPIAEAALRVRAPIVSANLSRPLIRKISQQGLDALGEARITALGLHVEMPDHLAERMREEIRGAHCNMLPDAHVGTMSLALRARDAHMASVMVNEDRRGRSRGVILIAGNGHVRNDHGVPWHLSRMAPGGNIVAIGLIEVSDGESDPAIYVERFGTGRMPFDYVWFTPRVDNEDPCKKFEKQLRRFRKPASQPKPP